MPPGQVCLCWDGKESKVEAVRDITPLFHLGTYYSSPPLGDSIYDVRVCGRIGTLNGRILYYYMLD